jgi:predicted dehydrogenase
MKNTINWALAGTGKIANKFLIGLGATGGRATAVFSRTQENAQRFAAQNGIEKTYTHYDHMLEDPDIDVVYIGTPHTSHKDLAVRALRAKKAVLCEKPCAINAGELREMLQAARENNVFFMEAMWTRFTPALVKVREWLSQGLIGEASMIEANIGFRAPFDPKDRLFNPELGGGALLDVGIYPLSMISMVFGGKKPDNIISHIYTGQTGVDEKTMAILSYGRSQVAYAAASLTTQLSNDLWIYGTLGMIHIPNFIWARDAELLVNGEDKLLFATENYISNGYNYEAEEVMRCIRAGKTESEIMPWDESLVLMETMDKIRAQGNFRYPSEN